MRDHDAFFSQTAMFSPRHALFAAVRCPDLSACARHNCLFSHNPALALPSLIIPAAALQPAPRITITATPTAGPSTVPAKRPTPGASSEPPRKLQKLARNAKKPSAPVSPSSHIDAAGVPLLRVSPALSQVPIPVRQTMLKNLYDHFQVLYASILPDNPTLAAEHSLKQEEEVYKNSTKLTYRNAVITTIASIKKRPPPDSISHNSVGTDADIASRAEKKKSLSSLRVTRTHLEPYVLSVDDMTKWGYFVQVPDEPGGTEPSLEGKVATCERCGHKYQVTKEPADNECTFHWGRPYSRVINGEKARVFTCCSRPVSDGGGCSRGSHVFYESACAQLHARHPFSTLADPVPGADPVLDLVVLDCEMIYTTGGMRVARVSILDGSGTEIFDEFVRMDDGVDIVDYNTRFSGITAENYSQAVLTLSSVRKSLDSLIDQNTILVGHALDNDLKTLRIIHHQCVDTALLPQFVHRAGPPYRRSLKDLVKEFLGRVIQTGGGTTGHSSLEDTSATLDLVRWHVLHKQPKGGTKSATTSATA